MKKKASKPQRSALPPPERPNTLSDLTLQPWSPQRIWTGALLGMAYPNLGAEGRDQFKRTNVYPQAVRDVSIFLYLSTLKPAEVDEAERNPDEAMAKARSFAIKRGIHMRGSEAFWDAYNKFWQVMSEIEAAATKPKEEGEQGGNSESEDAEFPNG